MIERNYAHLGLKLLMIELPRATFTVTDPGENSPWVHADEPLNAAPLGRPARWAIWKATGNVHRVQEQGEPYPEAVTDDPVYEVPPGWRTNEAAIYDNGGLWAIQAERTRQVEEEGRTGEHDDTHHFAEMAFAAACYAAPTPVLRADGYAPYLIYSDLWPWHGSEDKRIQRPGFAQEVSEVESLRLVRPDSGPDVAARIHELSKAGALIAAEIDRLTRHGEQFEYDDEAE